jgi:hypothetical protein
MVTVAEALLGTDAVDVEDSEDESEAQQFTLHEYDPDAPEESLGQFSQMYHYTFRQELGSDDETEEFPQREPLTVRNPDSEKESGEQDQQFALHEYDSEEPEESLGKFSQMYYHTFRQEMGSDDETQESPRRGPLTVRNPDSEESGDQQFKLHKYDPDAPEESLGKFSQMYHHTFRQEVDSDDESEDATEESPRRGALTVRNL